MITNFEFSINDIELEVIRWTKEKEIEDLLKIDIGIYPLIDEKWVEGKSGLKALQYMALGIPTVASNIGNTLEVINHMENGILVNSDEEWLNAFIMLIDNLELRKKIGINSKKTILEEYSVEKIGQEYKKVLLDNWEFLPEIFLTSSTKHIGKENLIGYIRKLNKDLKLFK